MIGRVRLRSGPYEGYINETDNNKLIAKLDWNINQSNNADASGTTTSTPSATCRRTRSCSASTTPAAGPTRAACRSRTPATPSTTISTRSRWSSTAGPAASPTGSSRATTGSATSATPFSEDFPTIEIGEGGVTYTTRRATSRSRSTTSSTRTSGSSPTTSPGSGASTRSRSARTSSRSPSSTRSTSSGTGSFPSLPARLPRRQHVLVARRVLRRDRPEQPRPDRFQFVRSGPARSRARTSTSGSSAFYAQDEFLVSRPVQPHRRRPGRLPDVLHRSGGQPVLPRPHRAGRERPAGDGGSEQPSRARSALFSPRIGFNWNAVGDRTHPDPRRHRHLHRPGAVRLGRQRDLQSRRQPESARPAPGPTRSSPRTTRSSQQSFDVNAMVPGLQVAPGLDHRPGDRPAARRRIPGHARGDLRRTTSTTCSCGTPIWSRRSARCPTAGRTTAAPATQRAQPRRRRRHLRHRQHRATGYTFNVTAQLRKTFGFGLAAQRRLQLHRGEEQPQVERDRERAVAEPADPGQPEQPGAELLGVRPAAPDRRRRHLRQAVVAAACARRSASSSRSPRATASPARAATATRSSTPAT